MVFMQVLYSHIDIVGRPVVALEKSTVIPEHSLYFHFVVRFIFT
jgi:oligosaccharyltransferase complex subunit alpha (ribophorin I)